MADRSRISTTFLIICVVWMGVFKSFAFWAPSFWSLVAISVIAGFGNSLYHPLGSVTTGSLMSRNRGLGIAVYSTGGNLGYALTPLFVIPVVTMTSLPLSYVILAAPAVLGAVIMVASKVHRSEINTNIVPSMERPAAIWEFLRERAGKNLIYLTGVVAVRSWGLYSMIVFVPHLYSRLGYGDLAVGWILSAFLIGGTVTGMFGGFISDRVGRLPTISVSTGLGAIFLCLGLLQPGLSGIGLLVLGSASLQAAFPVAIAFAQELSPSHAAMSSGIMMGFSWGLGAVGASITGVMADKIGIVLALVIVVLMMLPVAIWTWLWRPYGKKNRSSTA